MSGPIVRSGPSPEFSKNWDSVFGKKSGVSGKKSGNGAAAPAKKAVKGPPVKKAAKKAVAKKTAKSKG
ncbi:MAG: hypothetical protein ACREHD_25940 [Pirellulales bacterium]